jgi:signal transduction histidine kinase
MWLMLKLFFRTLTRLLRQLGLGLLLIPVSMVGILLFGLHAWTVLAVLMAIIIAIWWPKVASVLLPAAMVTVGIAGLVLAATMAGPAGNWMTKTISVFQVNAVPAKAGQGWLVKTPAGVQVVAVPAAAARFGAGFVVPAAVQANMKAQGAARNAVVQRALKRAKAVRVPPAGKGIPFKRILLPQPRPVRFGEVTVSLGSKAHSFSPAVFPPGGGARLVGSSVSSSPLTSSPWAGRLVPVALLLIALGLWLTPRTIAQLRSGSPGLLPYLRRRMLEIRWGILLVPAAVLGLTVFGVNGWTLASIVVAAAVTLRWPRVAADLVPVALILFAVWGFVLTARWESAPLVLLARQPQLYGAVVVSSRQLAVLAGAEASAFLAMAAWLFPRTIVTHSRMLVTPGPNLELEGRVQRLTETRDHALHNAASELRRIERDLHDGAQARLVALGMNLRAVERMLPASPEAALALVAEARETSVRALNDLRDLIRGICPPVLADRGLGHAVRALALDTPLPVVLDIDLPGRLAAAVESACYFAVAEVLANAVKHSGARLVHLRIQHRDNVLRIEVSDDGVGGADPANGTGLRGIERRLGTFDGILAVNSPTGGPTMIVMEVPCALLSPKTCSC